MDPNQAQFAATQLPDKSAGNYKLDRTGQQLGSYRLLKLLAGGGFAEVYLGEHVHLNTHAAIKVLQTQLVSEDLELFLAESRIVARLRHPHIVSILDFNVQGNTPFLVMDYAPNGNLRQRHPKHTVVPLATIILYLRQVGDALQYAHNERVIHRDIKPENMLIGGRNEILLSDFGIAIVEHSSRIQMTHDVIGTLAYMPPEQLQGKPRQASDQYALGVVVYEWLRGDCPFHGTIAEIAAQHLHNLPPSLRERNPNIPQAVEDVVFRAMAKDPEQRYPKMLDFINAFEAASHQQPLRLRDNSVETTSSAAAYAEDFHLTDTVRGGPFEHLAQEPAFSNGEGKARISRRAVLVGLVGLTTLGLAGGGITWLAEQYIHNQPHKSATRPRTAPTPTATPVAPGRTLFKYLGHSDAVNTVAWSRHPGGTYIVSGGKDHSVQVWFASSGTPARSTYGGHSDAVNAVAWSPDGKTIASASADRTVQVWVVFAGSGAPYTYSGHGDTVNAVVWSPDGAMIASASSDNTVQVWNASDGSNAYAYQGHSDAVNAVAWSPDGTTIASGGNDIIVRLWKPSDGGDIMSYTGHGDVVKGLAWSPDGKYIASASADKTVQVWEAATGTMLYTYRGHSDAVNAATWSPDGKTLASASNDQTAQVWHYADGSNAFSYQGHSDVVNAVAWSSNGIVIASASTDKTVQEWEGFL
jgi:eukaryotic-like serine/threonine-protein kinase